MKANVGVYQQIYTAITPASSDTSLEEKEKCTRFLIHAQELAVEVKKNKCVFFSWCSSVIFGKCHQQ